MADLMIKMSKKNLLSKYKYSEIIYPCIFFSFRKHRLNVLFFIMQSYKNLTYVAFHLYEIHKWKELINQLFLLTRIKSYASFSQNKISLKYFYSSCRYSILIPLISTLIWMQNNIFLWITLHFYAKLQIGFRFGLYRDNFISTIISTLER